MKRLASPVFVVLVFLLAACGGGGGIDTPSNAAASPAAASPPVPTLPSGYPGEAASCTLAGQKRWIDDYMRDQYFWSANQPAPNAAARSVDAYFQSQLFVPIDRYSFTQELEFFTQFTREGTRTGFGYSMAFADASQTRLQIQIVEPLSPAAAAGLQRGDTVLGIDGFSPANIVSGSLTTVVTPGVRRIFSLENSAGIQRTVTVVSRNFPLSAVFADRVLTAANGAKVGYLAYQDFSDQSLPALGAAFDRFRAAGATELIVDVRYNGGGSVQVARALASLIGGTSLDGQTFASIRFNAQNKASDFDFAFTGSTASLPAAPLEGLTQVVFITSASTASASELVINSLYPFKKVVTIGATTFGKPYGFQPRSTCDTVYNAVNFETFNAVGAGRFNNGLPATCTVADDLSKALGDPTERRTAAALGYLQTQTCPAVANNSDTGLQAQSPGASGLSDSAATRALKRRMAERAFGELSQPAMFMD